MHVDVLYNMYVHFIKLGHLEFAIEYGEPTHEQKYRT